MSLTPDEVRKIAHLARLRLSPEDMAAYTEQLTRIFNLIAELSTLNTETIEPLAHPLAMSQRLRPDIVNEPDLHEKYQEIAPQVEAGLYLVPKVIEEIEEA